MSHKSKSAPPEKKRRNTKNPTMCWAGSKRTRLLSEQTDNGSLTTGCGDLKKITEKTVMRVIHNNNQTSSFIHYTGDEAIQRQ